MNDYRIQKINKLNIALLIIMMICILCCAILFVTPSAAYAAETNDAINYDTYTDSKTFMWNGTQRSISDFINNDAIIKGNMSFSPHPAAASGGHVFSATITGDHPIVNVIPKQLFNTTGNHLHIGKEYGFFVNTVENTTIGGKLSTVVVFEINTTGLDLNNNGIFAVEVKPIFQRQYRYVTPEMSVYRFIGDSDHRVPDYYSGTATIGVTEDRVVPNVRLLKVDGAWQADFSYAVNEYYLKDVSFAMNLLNEQEVNQGTSSYYASENDNGAYFTYFDYEYYGVSREKKALTDDDKNTIASTCVDLGLSLIKTVVSFIPGGGAAVSLADLGLKMIGAAGKVQTIWHYATEADNYLHESDVEVSSGKLTAKHFFPNKSDQISQYGNLAKTAAIVVNTTEDGKTILYGNNNNFKGYFKVGHSAPDGEPMWYTRLLRQIALKVVTTDGDEVACATSSYNYNLGSERRKSIELEREQNMFVLNNGAGKYVFTPAYTSDYEISLVCSSELNVKINNQFATLAKNNEYVKTYKYKMQAGQTYNIDIIGDDSARVVPLRITPHTDTSNISLAANEKYLVKVAKDTATPVRRLSFGNDIKITDVLVLADGRLGKDAQYVNFNGDVSVDVWLGQEDYYLCLQSKSNKDSALQKSNISSVSLNAETPLSLVEGGGFRAVAFDCSKTGFHTLIKVLNASDGNFAGNVFVEVFSRQKAKLQCLNYDMGLFASQLDKGIYYVFVKSALADRSVKVVLQEEYGENQLLWQVASMAEAPYVFKDAGAGSDFTIGKPPQGTESFLFRLKIGESTYIDKVFGVDGNYGGGWQVLDGGIFVVASDCALYTRTNQHLRFRAKKDMNSSYDKELNIKVILKLVDLNISQTIDYVDAVKITIQKQADITGGALTYGNGTKVYLFSFGSSNEVVLDIQRFLAQNSVIDTVKIEFKCFTTTQGEVQNNADSVMTSGGKNLTIDINCMYSRLEVKGKLFPTYTYYVANALQFSNVRQNQYPISLENDIDLSKAYPEWTPIKELKVAINGKGKLVKGMSITCPSSDVTNIGLIGTSYVGAMLLRVEGKIDLRSYSGSSFINVGGIVGYNAKTAATDDTDEEISHIFTCSFTGNITVPKAASAVGGVAGINEGTLWIANYNSQSSGRYGIYGYGDVGGIAGRNLGKIKSCTAYNASIEHKINGIERSSGGLVGYCNNGVIEAGKIVNVIVVSKGTFIPGFCPRMGLAVGHLLNAEFTYSQEGACSFDCSALPNADRKYCFNGVNGYYGLMVNSTIGSTPGQNGP